MLALAVNLLTYSDLGSADAIASYRLLLIIEHFFVISF